MNTMLSKQSGNVLNSKIIFFLNPPAESPLRLNKLLIFFNRKNQVSSYCPNCVLQKVTSNHYLN